MGGSLLGNILAGKGVNGAGEGVILRAFLEEIKSRRQGRGIVRATYGKKKGRKETTKGHKNKKKF